VVGVTKTDDVPDSDALLDALRTSDHALRLSDGERTAFAVFDPDAGGGESEEFYWYEYEWGEYGLAATDDVLSEADLTSRITTWADTELVTTDQMAGHLVETGPTRRWFWADSVTTLESQIQSHYHSTITIANKSDLISPEAESFVVEDTLTLGNLWPETRERDAEDWPTEDHNARTATSESPVYNHVEFYETAVHAGHGYYVAELPRRDLLRQAFADERPSPEAETTPCTACLRERPATARFCDWCGRSLRTRPPQTWRERARRAVGQVLDRGWGLLADCRERVGERLWPWRPTRRGR